jgi:hypothetical protein
MLVILIPLCALERTCAVTIIRKEHPHSPKKRKHG